MGTDVKLNLVAKNKDDISENGKEILRRLANERGIGFTMDDESAEPERLGGLMTGAEFIDTLRKEGASVESINAASKVDLNALYIVNDREHDERYKALMNDLDELSVGRMDVEKKRSLGDLKDVPHTVYKMWSSEQKTRGFRPSTEGLEHGLVIETKDNLAASWFIGEKLKERGVRYEVGGTSIRIDDEDLAEMFVGNRTPAAPAGEMVVSQGNSSRAKVEESEYGVTLFTMIVASQSVVAQFDAEGKVTGFKTANKETKSDDFKKTRDAIIADTSIAKRYNEEVEIQARHMIESMSARYGETRVKDAEFMIDYAKDMNVNIYTGPVDQPKKTSSDRLTSSIAAKMAGILATEKSRQIAYLEVRERELQAKLEEAKKIKDEEKRKQEEERLKAEEERNKQEEKRMNTFLLATTAAITLATLKGGALDKIIGAKTIDECSKVAEEEALEAKSVKEAALNMTGKEQPEKDAPRKSRGDDLNIG